MRISKYLKDTIEIISDIKFELQLLKDATVPDDLHAINTLEASIRKIELLEQDIEIHLEEIKRGLM